MLSFNNHCHNYLFILRRKIQTSIFIICLDYDEYIDATDSDGVPTPPSTFPKISRGLRTMDSATGKTYSNTNTMIHITNAYRIGQAHNQYLYHGLIQ